MLLVARAMTARAEVRGSRIYRGGGSTLATGGEVGAAVQVSDGVDRGTRDPGQDVLCASSVNLLDENPMLNEPRRTKWMNQISISR